MALVKKPRCTRLAAAALVFLAGCATSPEAFRAADRAASGGDYQDALKDLSGKAASLYGDKNQVSYRLDSGMVRHYAADWAGSSADLEEAGRLIQEAFTKSVTESISTFILNDNTRTYGGEDYEDIYLNVFNALNYYNAGNTEDAMVEIRQMNEKLRALSTKYAAEISRVENYAAQNGAKSAVPADKAPPFSNSALGNYLGLLFYRARGPNDAGNARVSAEEAQKAWTLAPDVYTTPLPQALRPQNGGLCEELDIPAGKARLNLLAFAGLSPVKREEAVDLPFIGPSTGTMIGLRIALPALENRRSVIDRIEAVVENANGETEKAGFELLEDMSAVARDTFRQREALVAIKTTTRSLIKVIAADAAAKAAIDNGVPELLALAGVLVFTKATEQADLRSARYFPGRAYIAGLTLSPGPYTVTVNYLSGGRVVSRFVKEVDLREGGLNLVETVSLK